MMRILQLILGLGWLVSGAAGRWWPGSSFAPHASLSLSLGAAVVLYALLRLTMRRARFRAPSGPAEPRPIRLRLPDHVKAALCWMNAFRRTYAVEPGLYFTGDRYDRGAPLLVTANAHLTVWTLLRALRFVSVRLLVVDTGGINVWCSAAKGRFSSAAVLEQVARYDRGLFADGARPTLVLPKLALAGIDLRTLRREGFRPVVGPVHARDLPSYLASASRLTHRAEDRVVFGLRARIFTWLPGLVQTAGYSLAVALAVLLLQGGWVNDAPLGIVALSAVIATAYPLLYPRLPGTRFATKGLGLAAVLTLGLLALFVGGALSSAALVVSVPFTFATALFFALSYSGNSAVSNYSRVRREIARFLPLDVLLYAASVAAFIAMGVSG